jgi:hypothetical protein
MAKQAAKQGKRVLHVTCEMGREQVPQRYLMAGLTAGTSKNVFTVTELDVHDKTHMIRGMRFGQKREPEINIRDPNQRAEVIKGHKQLQRELGCIMLKEFPSGSLSMGMLEGYLDYLSYHDKFHPDLLIVDYPDLMKQDTRDIRVSLGRTFVNLRGLLAERNMAGFFPTQSNRGGLSAKKVTADMVAEDITKVNTADIVLTYSRTEKEKEQRLARLFMSNARNNEDGFTVIINQSYPTGQYLLQSALMEQKLYWELLDRPMPTQDDMEEV